MDNVEFLEGCEGVSVLGQVFIGRELLDAWKVKGIRYLSTRTIGYNHIDVKYAGKIGIRVSHASYDTNGVADPDALIEGIESEKIGALGLDVLEREEGIIHVDHRIDIISNQKMAYLRQFRNVTMTPHMAFYTEEAVKSMVETGILGLLDMQQNEKGKLEVV
ncbi:NAD(P)-dependent oxidoreductase [Jingyaoa shaoxingensis]|uniref:D-lactate dehydrogenase n=1 Tax=Jingyaoa shaoxingensis TaxID=2763671 RepID=A0ABR7NA51_9FIRM|nr:hypothetical protein [Jingyaoa shaoxingensis]